MLDQNTDRMWYVIGAVLIGAAIILMANDSTSLMFGSIAGVFVDEVEEEETVMVDEDIVQTDGIQPPTEPGVIKLDASSLEEVVWALAQNSNNVSVFGVNNVGYVHKSFESILMLDSLDITDEVTMDGESYIKMPESSDEYVGIIYANSGSKKQLIGDIILEVRHTQEALEESSELWVDSAGYSAVYNEIQLPLTGDVYYLATYRL